MNWLGKIPAYQPPPVPLSQGKRVTVSSQFDQPGYYIAVPPDPNDEQMEGIWATLRRLTHDGP